MQTDATPGAPLDAAPVQCNRCGRPFADGETRHEVTVLPGKWAIPPKVIVHEMCRWFEPGEQVPTSLPELVRTLTRKIVGREQPIIEVL